MAGIAPSGVSSTNYTIGFVPGNLTVTPAPLTVTANPSTKLYARIPHGEGQTILREALLIADHNAYHLGELVLVRRLLGAWK